MKFLDGEAPMGPTPPVAGPRRRREVRNHGRRLNPSTTTSSASSSHLSDSSTSYAAPLSASPGELGQRIEDVFAFIEFGRLPQVSSNAIPRTPEAQQFFSFTLFPDEDENLQLKIGPTLEYLGIDSSFLASLPGSKSVMAAVKQLKISKLPDPQFLVGLIVYISLQTLEFDGCLFHSKPPGGYFPTTLIKLKITNCINSEHILAALMCQKGLPLESLEINGCSSLYSFLMDKLPATLRQLNIVNCVNLKSLSESSEIKNCHSVVFGPVGDSGLES
ncbi:hypothetical protein Q3G72_015702 [Acer saccharum]|nr:hypothetical protein Q3G72_015702 [Acer saccharum]